MRTENMYLEIVNSLCDGVYAVDAERRVTFWNKAAEDITGYSKEELTGQCNGNSFPWHMVSGPDLLNNADSQLHATLIDGRQRKDEALLRHRNGHCVPVQMNIFPVVEDGVITGAIEIFSPKPPAVCDDKLIEKLSDLAMTDQMTGLANRRKIESYLEYSLHGMKRFGSKFCVVFLDIDNFGLFNNTYGHDAGDEALRGVAGSLSRMIRKDDLFGRWGGEEFVGVFGIKNDYEATLIAEKARVLISGIEIPRSDEALTVTASVGVTVARDDDTIASVVKRADTLMYQSKRGGKNLVSADV